MDSSHAAVLVIQPLCQARRSVSAFCFAQESKGYTGPYNSPGWLEKPAFIQSFEVRPGAVQCHELCMQ
jgi:hypothetical protein